MSDEIRINGNAHSWGSITVKFDGDRFFGFTSIGYADARERVKAYGMGRAQAPRGRSRGKYTTEPVTLTGWKGSVQQLRQALADAGDGESYGDTLFQIVVQYVEADDTPVTVELEDCVWTKNTSSDEEGPDPLSEDIEIDCMRIRRNGLVLFDNSEGS
ncbi:MAG: hypothetical protein IH885_10275 [Myxococcales bacterium]|nr:hypothetical protein [Myxococcales bacterium]